MKHGKPTTHPNHHLSLHIVYCPKELRNLRALVLELALVELEFLALEDVAVAATALAGARRDDGCTRTNG